MVPAVSLPMEDEEMNSLMALNIVAKRFEVVAFVTLLLVPERRVEKKFVVVAAVPVAFTKVKFWRVEEPVTKRFENETDEVEMSEPTVSWPIDDEEI